MKILDLSDVNFDADVDDGVIHLTSFYESSFFLYYLNFQLRMLSQQEFVQNHEIAPKLFVYLPL